MNARARQKLSLAEKPKDKSDGFVIKKDQMRRVVAASKVQKDGTRLDMAVQHGCDADGCSASISFFQNSRERLKISTVVAPQRTQLAYTAESEGLKLHWMIDASTYLSNKKALITGEVNGNEFKGTFDGLVQRATANLDLADWLSDDTKEWLEEFRPALNVMKQSIGERVGGGGMGGGRLGGAGGSEGASGGGLPDIRPEISWNGVGRALCWGLGGIASHLAGRGAGLAGVIGSLAAGIAASACSDSYGP
jgi:hypothetical protein